MGTVTLVVLTPMLLIVIELHPVWYLPPCGAFAFSNGFVMPNAVGIGINVEPEAAGTASGLIVAG